MKKNRIIKIPTPALFSFDECLWFLNRNYDDCLHIIRENELIKAIELDGKAILISITAKDTLLQVEILQGNLDKKGEGLLKEFIVEWYDLKRDIEPFYKLLKKDGRLNYMLEDFEGLRLVGIHDLFEALCWSIIGQQINLAFAYKLKRRLVEKYGTSIAFENEKHYIFPKPEVLANASIDDLRAMQFSGRKAEYVIGVAKAFASRKLSRELIDAFTSVEEKQQALVNLKGIGLWTANYALMKSARVPNCIPHGDIGLLNALSKHQIIKDRSEIKKIDAFFKKYQGWESYLVFYLWRSLAVKS